MKVFQQKSKIQKFTDVKEFVGEYQICESDFILASKSIYEDEIIVVARHTLNDFCEQGVVGIRQGLGCRFCGRHFGCLLCAC